MTYGEYMLLSSRHGDLDAIKECLLEEVPLDHIDPEMGNTALHLASANGNIEVVKFLLEQGAESKI